MGKCLGKRDFAGDVHVGRDVDHLVETEFSFVHEIHHFRGDRNLVGAGHGEGLIAVYCDTHP